MSDDSVDLGVVIEMMRPKNALLGAMTVPIGALIAIGTDITAYPEILAFSTLSVILFMGHANILNDINDYKIDKTAHPKRAIPSGKITIEAAKYQQRLILVSAFAFALLSGYFQYTSFGLESALTSTTIFLFAYLSIEAYERKFKSSGFIGNLLISVLVGLVLIYGASAVSGINDLGILYIACCAMFGNLAREMVKDCQDIDGDVGRETLPMKIGVEKTRIYAYVFVLASLVMLYMPYWQGPFEFNQLVLQTPVILLLITLNGKMMGGEDQITTERIRMAMLLALLGFIITKLV